MNPIEQCERDFAAHFGMKYGVMMCNGTATLHCCLLAAGVGPGDEVIVPPLTMSSPALAVRYCGAKPVYADINKFTWTIDPKAIRMKLTPKTKAIIAVALYGLPCDMDAIMQIAAERDLVVIEDNAQCLTPARKAQLLSFSFQQTKHITCGEGGMVLTNDPVLASKVATFGNLGYRLPIEKDEICRPDAIRHYELGYNYRPSQAQAELLLQEIPLIDAKVSRRQSIAAIYRQALEGTHLLNQQHDPQGTHSYWTFAASRQEGSWHKFVEMFRRNGGDRVYGAWALSYREPALLDPDAHCRWAESFQPVMLQFKTNYADMDKAKRQAEILRKTVEEYRL